MPPRSRNSLLLDQVEPGDEIEVWWPHDAQYYSGVVGARLPSGRHRIFYNDGEIEDLKLATEQWRLIGAAASRILSSRSAPSLDAPPLEPQAHLPASQLDENQPTNEQAQPAQQSPPAPSSNTKTTTTGKKRGRPRGRKSDTTKTAKPKATRAPQSSSSSVANETEPENKTQLAKPVSAKATPTTKPKATAVKKRQRSSSTPAQDSKTKPKSNVVTAGNKPLLDADEGLIDAAPLAPKTAKQSSASPTPLSNASTVPMAATLPSSETNPVQTAESQKKSGVVSKTSHTPTLVPSASTKAQTGTKSSATTPATVPTKPAEPPHATTAKKNAAASPKAPPAKTSSRPRSDNIKSRAITTKSAVTQKASEATGLATPSDPKKGRTSTSVRRQVTPIAPALTTSARNGTTAVRIAPAPITSTVTPTANSTSHSGNVATPKESPAPLKPSPPISTGKQDAGKSAEMTTPRSQQKTFVLTASGSLRTKPSQPTPKFSTPGKLRLESGDQAEQVKPQQVSETVETPKDTARTVPSKMALATIVSGHKEQKETATTRSDGRSSGTPSGTSKQQDTTKQGTNQLKKGNSSLQTAQKGSSKSKGPKASKSLGVKKAISKPVKTISLKRFVTTPLPNAKGSGARINPKDGSDIIADVTVPRKSKSGISSPLLRSPLHVRPSFPSPNKPAPKPTDVGAIAKTGSALTKFTLDQAGSKPTPTVDPHTQDKGERPGSKLGPFQPTRRRLKSQSGGTAYQGQHQSPTRLPGKAVQQKIQNQPTVSDKDRRGRPSDPQKLTTQREKSVTTEPPGTKSYRVDQTSQRASKHSPMPRSTEVTVPQASTRGTVSVTRSLQKASASPTPKLGRVQPQSQQTDGSSNVAATSRKQLPAVVTAASHAPKELKIDNPVKTGVKRAASETLNNAKRRRPNMLKATASSTAANVSTSEKVQVETVTNAINEGGINTQENCRLPLLADAANIAPSKSPRTQAADDENATAGVCAPHPIKTTDNVRKNTLVQSSGKTFVSSKDLVKAPQGEKDQPPETPSDTPKTSALEASEQARQSNSRENGESVQKSEPAAATPPKSFARVRQRPSAGPNRPNDSSERLINIPKDASKMSPSSDLDAIKQAVREANMESLEPQLAPIVTRIEKCFADSDRRIRSLQGQLDSSTKELESLQKQLQELQKAMSYVPSISEVRSLLESQALEMKQATAVSMESVISAVKEDMKEYFPRAIKTGMENVAAMVQKDSVMMISKAVDSAMTSGLLQDMPRASESSRGNGSQNAVDVQPSQDVADEGSLREAGSGSAKVHSYLNRERSVDNGAASRPPSSSRSFGTGLGTLGRESKQDGHSGNAMNEPTRSRTSDPNARPSNCVQRSQGVAERENDPNLSHREPVLSSTNPGTGAFERSTKLSAPTVGEIPRRPSMPQSGGEKNDPEQKNHAQSSLPRPNGLHHNSSARPDAMTPASGTQGSNVGLNGLSAIAKSSTVGRGSKPKAPLAKKENYGLVSTRVKVLLALSAVEWFLKGGCRETAPSDERELPVTHEWVRKCVQRALAEILERLSPEKEYRDTMSTLTQSLGSHIQTDWLVKGATPANIDIARENYIEWDPKVQDFEWDSEKRVLAMLSDEIRSSEKILMTAGEIFEDPLRTAVRCLEHATRYFRS